MAPKNTSPDAANVAVRLKRALVQMGYGSQRLIARTAHISECQVRRISTFTHTPTPSTIVRIEKALRKLGFPDRPGMSLYSQDKLLAEVETLRQENCELKARLRLQRQRSA